MSKNPSITNCPAYVPVMVELCPAANNPIAQMSYFHQREKKRNREKKEEKEEKEEKERRKI